MVIRKWNHLFRWSHFKSRYRSRLIYYLIVLESLINKIIFDLKDKTLIYITHKLQNIQDFDYIFVMKDGEIV